MEPFWQGLGFAIFILGIAFACRVCDGGFDTVENVIRECECE